MSPRIKSDNSKHHRFEIRLDDEMNNILEECSERLNITRTDVVNKGIKMVKEDLDKRKSSCHCFDQQTTTLKTPARDIEYSTIPLVGNQ